MPVYNLPKTREEYTAWALEFSGKEFIARYGRHLTTNSQSLEQLVSWTKYTVRTYPNLVHMKLLRTSFVVDVAGVTTSRYTMQRFPELAREIMDKPECKVTKM